MEAEAGEAPPFWMEANRRRHHRWNQNRVVTAFLSPVALIPAVVVAAILVSYIPSLLSPLVHLVRRALLFKSWDAFNFLLVLFAILAGIFVRTASPPSDDHQQQHEQESDHLASKLFEYPVKADDQRRREHEGHDLNVSRELKPLQNNNDGSHLSAVKEEAVPSKEAWPSGGGGGLKSELDLAGDRSTMETFPSTEKWFSVGDDDQKGGKPGFSGDRLPKKNAHPDFQEIDVESPVPVKTIHVDSSTLIHRKYLFLLPPPSPPPPPPPPLPPSPPMAKVKVKGSRQRGKDASIMALTSLSFRKKDKKMEKEKKSNAVTIPAPPPLPPPPSFFHNLFANLKKEAKIERPRVHSVSIPPPPPPPPPPTTLHPSTIKGAASTRKSDKTRKENVGSRDSSIRRPVPLPPLIPAKEKHKTDSLSHSGRRSLTPPLPPPTPPFLRMEQNISMESEYDSKRSDLRTEYEGPVEQKQSEEEERREGVGGGGGSPPFCPSPDVNVKADKFIARFREGIRLEKLQSLRDRMESEDMK